MLRLWNWSSRLNLPPRGAKNDGEPEELDRQVRVSRNVEEHELENALRPLPQHGEKMKELLLRLFNLEDPETAAPRTADRWIIRLSSLDIG